LDESIHARRCLAQLRSKDKNIEKYIYLSALKEQDPEMFYQLCLEHMSEFTPIIYTPTVGDACLQYSHIYRRPEGLVSDGVILILEILTSHSVHFYQRQGQDSQWYVYSLARMTTLECRVLLVIGNWPKLDEARISVVTDGQSTVTYCSVNNSFNIFHLTRFAYPWTW
jgi:malate dehydrogenase (oxaloacetate-decarboxylating)(NADP+)